MLIIIVNIPNLIIFTTVIFNLGKYSQILSQINFSVVVLSNIIVSGVKSAKHILTFFLTKFYFKFY